MFLVPDRIETNAGGRIITENRKRKRGNKSMNKEYESIMKRLSSLADENGMVSLDAVAEVINQELVPGMHPSANETV